MYLPEHCPLFAGALPMATWGTRESLQRCSAGSTVERGATEAVAASSIIFEVTLFPHRFRP